MVSDPGNLSGKKVKRRRFRWKLVLLFLGILLLLVFIFQKPILLAAIRWEIARSMEGQGFELQCVIEGDPIHYLEFKDLELRMSETDALASLKIKRIKATYDIFAFIFSGWDYALMDVEIEDTNLVLRETEKGAESGYDSFWVPFVKSLRLKNFNMERGALHLTKMDMELLPEGEGFLRIGEFEFPKQGVWKKLSAATRYERGKIELLGLELEPYVKADSLKFDGSKLSSKKLAIVFKGLLFGGETELEADWQGEKDEDLVKVTAKGKNLSLDRASDLLRGDEAFGGGLETLDLQFSGAWQNPGTWNGLLQAGMKNGTVNGMPAWETCEVKAASKDGKVSLEQFSLVLDGRNSLTAKGEAQLAAPFRYAGEVQGKLEDLGALQGLLEMGGVHKEVAGRLEVNWSGEGEGGLQPEAKHQGQGYVLLQGGSFGETGGIEAELRGNYTPEQAVFQTVRASAAGWRLASAGSWANRRLKLDGLGVFRGERQLLKGTADVPFYPGEWRQPGRWLTPEDPVNVQLQGKGIQLESLMTEFGAPRPWKGEVSLDLNAGGTLKELRVQGALEGKNLVPGLNPDFLPAQLKVDLNIREGKLNVFATLDQPSLQPVKVWGSMEFRAADFLNGSEDWMKAPIRAELAMASLDLSRARRFFPQILDIQGRAGADVHLAGSVEDPILWGEVDLNIPRLRFKQRAIPNLTDAVARLKFEKRRMEIETMRGNLAGGPFQAGGKMDFSKLTNPQMEVRLTGKDLLLYRDDQVTSRADVLLDVKGPFTKANVTGTVALTKSQFYRDIDILPIGLPGRSAPQLQGSLLPEFSVKLVPIRNWNFDVRISNKDPFLIKGNLANGRIDAQLHLTGTGLEPKLDGAVSVTNLEATLPFSTMLIDRGYLYFKPDRGLNATLDFRGTSKIQDYQVTAYVYGTVLRPQTLFVSQPPLSEQDIIALIATGSTTSELGSDSNVIAGKATSLIFQKIWRKLFPNAKVSKNELLDRVSFSTGSIDPDSATPALGASLRITDEVYVIFDSGTDGGFRGRVKYLIRFR